jgi:hypothetical protein
MLTIPAESILECVKNLRELLAEMPKRDKEQGKDAVQVEKKPKEQSKGATQKVKTEPKEVAASS